MPQSFVENWSAQLLLAMVVILLPFAVTFLLLSALRRYPEIPQSERFGTAGTILFATAWTCFVICLIDIFLFQTVVVTLLAAFLSAVTSTAVSGYLGYVARYKYNLIVRINNG